MIKNRVYGYARISKDDDDTRESIETQIDIIETYCRDKGLPLEAVFSDNDVSGLTFDRPQFNQLKALIERNEVDVLILKDLSRLGRSSARVSDFLDVLQTKQIRLILVNESHDAIFESTDTSRDMLDMRSLFNQFYSRDISRKVTANMRQRMKNDEGLIMNATYGYFKDPGNKNLLIVDEEAAEVIRYIYSLYLDDYGDKNISKMLNEKGIDTPSVHRAKYDIKGNNTAWKTGHLWYNSTVSKILQDDIYIGVLRCGKTRKTKMNGKSVTLPKEDHIVHEDHHEAIISREIFEKAQEIRASRRKNSTKGTNQKIHKYAGILRCGDCGNGFIARSWNTDSMGKRIQYRCASYHKFSNCSAHAVMQDELDEVIFEELSRQISLNKEILQSIEQDISIKDNNRITEELNRYQTEYDQVRHEIKNYAKQLAKGLIDEEIFQELMNETIQRQEFLQKKIKLLTETSNETHDHKKQIIKLIDLLSELISKQDLNNSEISVMIEKIIITEVVIDGESGVDVEIVWK